MRHDPSPTKLNEPPGTAGPDSGPSALRVSGYIRQRNRVALCGTLEDSAAPAAPIRLFLRIGDHTVAEAVTTPPGAARSKAGPEASDNFRLSLAAPALRRRISRAIGEAIASGASVAPYLRCRFVDGGQLDLDLFAEEDIDDLGTLGFDRTDGRDLYASTPTAADARAPSAVDVICFYLPQFHPVKENDQWWGPGFTEWVNVARAQKQFPTHNAPWLPADLGFYDLRLKDTRRQQADLARQYGVTGFCYYAYWFQGRRLLERPLQLLLEDGEPDLPFCLCWANENWSRRWDGSDAEILIAQRYDFDEDKKFIDDMKPWLADERYIRIDGKLLIMIYRPSLIPLRSQLFDHWRKRAQEMGLGELLICNIMTFGEFDPRPLNCDAAVEFPPHTAFASEISREALDAPASYEGSAYDYADVVRAALGRSFDFAYFPGVMPRWDNTPRKGTKGNVFVNSSPDLFEIWLRDACRRAMTQPYDRKLVFVNSWNEWAEGAHLEPDSLYGRAYLDVVRRVTSGAAPLANLLRVPGAMEMLSREELERALRQNLFFNETLGIVVEQSLARRADRDLVSGLPEECQTARLLPDAQLTITQLNNSVSPHVSLPRSATLTLRGTSFVAPHFPARHGRMALLLLRANASGTSAYQVVDQWQARADLHTEFAGETSEVYFGFEWRLVLSGLIPGDYQIQLIEFDGEGPVLLRSDRLLTVR